MGALGLVRQVYERGLEFPVPVSPHHSWWQHQVRPLPVPALTRTHTRSAAPAASCPKRDIHNSCLVCCVRFVIEAHTPARPMTCRVLPPGWQA
ncbi:hypothetical protein E2C01_048314 [Portunus trituberculatus]|uniref:Uncharacterized protein n=1 Tax=Portunus trituberculatus TaxID=210409 RepID=A0A5B7GB84_PORTR|nr:hypothetical protein [Portunus trituberculatus]